jgi:hypothetical protein
MLSPADYNSEIPRDKLGNLLWRQHVLDACEREPKYRAAVIEACRDDIFFYILTFVYQWNPNYIPGGEWEEYGPFVPLAFQVRAIKTILWHIDEREDLLILKSREMGVTWKCLIIGDWIFLFHKRKKGSFLSRNADAVDAKDSDSLFWKIDYMHSYLPLWILQGYDESKHRVGMIFNHPVLETAMAGQATTKAAFVGGRTTYAFFDEFPRVPNSFEILAGTAGATRCRLFNGTFQGLANAFYSLSQREDLTKLIIHWTDHPDKRRGAYRWSKTLKRIESLDPTFEYLPQCSKCLRMAKNRTEPSCPCGKPLQEYKFVTDGTPLGGPHPGIRSPWYDAEGRRIGSPEKVAEELDIDAVGSVSQGFDAGSIIELIGEARPPRWEGDLDHDWETGEPKKLVFRKGGPIKLWIRPDAAGRVPFGLYKIGSDISNGLGKTPSCASIADVARNEKVAELVAAYIKPDRFAGLMVALAKLFCTEDEEGAEIIWEGQGPGATFGEYVTQTLDYRNIYWRTVEQKFQKVRRADTPGWNPSPENKDHVLRQYGYALAAKDFTTPSEAELRECLKYQMENGHIVHPLEKGVNDPSGAKHNHGDLAMSAALCYKLVKEAGEAQRVVATARKQPDENSLDGRMRMWERTRHLAECWLE